jgi:2-oxo-hept-3-ene-1,7-dioate hydratase
MLPEDTTAALARELQAARRARTPLRHFSQRFPDMTVADGYAVQRAWVALELADGRTIRGRKIGLTSRAMQQASQITEPDYAPLMDDMFFEQGSDIPAARFIAPRVEVELAFVLGRALRGPRTTLFDVLAATDFVTPAIEIIDARIEQFDRETRAPRKVVDTISDFAANAGVVLGGRPVRPTEVDLRWVGALLHRNGVIGDRPRRRRAEPPGHRRGLARQQDRAARRAAERRRHRARRFLHSPGHRPGGRRLPCRLRPARQRGLPFRLSCIQPPETNP